MKQKPAWLLHEALIASADTCPEKNALIIGPQTVTYKRLLADALNISDLFISSGLQRGDRVALYLDNTYVTVVSLYATLFSGGVFVIMNPQIKSEKCAYILKDSGASILVTDAHLFDQLYPVRHHLETLSAFIYSGEPTNHAATILHPDALFFSEALSRDTAVHHTVPVIPNDLAALIYTSGTTGNPKGVMMSHQAMLFATQSLSLYLRLDETHTILNVLPMAFDYGLYQLLMSIYCGGTLLLERSFAFPAKTCNLIRQHAVTVFPGVPTVFTTLIGIHRRKPLCFPSVTRVTNTAAALPPDYTNDLRTIFPNALLYRMYGLTECKRVCYLEPELADSKPTSVGKAIPGTEVFLLSPEGHPCISGEPGILHVRGPHLMMGYWNDPELSAAMLIDSSLPGERVLRTNDWFTMDEDGDLYFIGRSDDIIKTRGEKVSPVEIEDVLLSMHGLREAAVIGVPDELLGQAVKAIVSLDDTSITEAMIKKHCSGRLENFMVPKYIEIVKELPKTESGKITKKSLR